MVFLVLVSRGITIRIDFQAEAMKEECLIRLENTLRKKYDDFENVFNNRDGTKSTKSVCLHNLLDQIFCNRSLVESVVVAD